MTKIIAVSGTDNTGKSTQCELLRAHMEKEGNVIVTENAFGYTLLKPLIKHLRKMTSSPTGGPVVINKNYFYKLFFIFAFIDIWINQLFYLRKLKSKYDYVICDRYFTDIWANLKYYGYINNFGFRYLLPILPKADIQIYLHSDPASAHKRGNDFELSYYQKQVRIYERLFVAVKKHKITALQPKEKVLRKLVSIVDTY